MPHKIAPGEPYPPCQNRSNLGNARSTTTTATTTPTTMTLSEQYRPTDFAQIVGQPADEVESLVNGRDTPNMLFHGPPGTGKTTTARCIARHLHGDTDALYELNASDERGIDTVRDKIQQYAHQLTVTGNPVIIFLDECDSMTRDAQQALRRPMENAPAIFLLAANDVGAIHDAVLSRCVTFEYDSVARGAIETRLQEIAADLETDVNTGQIASESDGDMRRALNLLERRLRFGTAESKPEADAVKQYL